ncbi:MAG: arginine deiminase family protein [Candidatus Sulfotelmatobacter sp.]
MPEAIKDAIPGAVTKTRFNGHSMVGVLQRVMVCSPRTAGWNRPGHVSRWQELGFHHAPDFAAAQSQHEALCRELQSAGAEVVELPSGDLLSADLSSASASDLSMDAVYTHDASLPTDHGLIVMRPGKPSRVAEGPRHSWFCASLEIPILGVVRSPATTEAGDMVWLDARTLLIGHGFRTNAAGIHQIRTMLAAKGIEVLSAPLPYGPGPSACLHLMSLISLLDEHTVLVDLPWLAVETVELLKSRGFQFIEIDSSERDTLACNVLALGNKRLLAIEENRKTNARLRQAGFDLRTFPGSELCINGSGGPTCLTRPLLRG